MSDCQPPTDPPDDSRREPVECPHCGEVTMPNLLADRSYVCSCPAERALPLAGGLLGLMPPPVDDRSFVSATAMHPKPEDLPDDAGQFGRDIQTDDFKPLRDPPQGPLSLKRTRRQG
jgi:hypothetical protein